MTVKTTLTGNKCVRRIVQNAADVAVTGVTTLAQLRCALGQQGVVDATVRLVARGTIFDYRFVLPQHGATKLRMTTNTIVIKRHTVQVSLAQTAMRIVAAYTGHNATGLRSRQWMMASLVHSGALFQVTAGAFGDLTYRVPDRVIRGMHLVAIGASQVFNIVCAEMPAFIRILHVTAQAYAVLQFRRDIGAGSKLDHRLVSTPVLTPGAVTGLTLQFRHRTVRRSSITMYRLQEAGSRSCVIVTTQASIGP
tara:strand:+ start:1012 stop:1764 length:753 start_codon:yes stop_codon:yes gene_type:complete